MSVKMSDISGQRFGKLTVLSFEKKSGKEYLWKCICDCGNETLADKAKLTLGRKKSCGCYKKEHAKTHGLSQTPIYATWYRIKNRCYNTNCDKYEYYGGRGIKVCDRWKDSFENFLLDMGNPPSSDYSIDRIDTNGDYSPDNCKWSTRKEQCRNRRSNVLLEYNSSVYCLTELCELLGIGASRVEQRIRKNTSIENIIPGARLLNR